MPQSREKFYTVNLTYSLKLFEYKLALASLVFFTTIWFTSNVHLPYPKFHSQGTSLVFEI